MSEVHCGGKKPSKAAAEKFESKEAKFEEAGGDVNQMASPSREGEGHGAIVLPPPTGRAIQNLMKQISVKMSLASHHPSHSPHNLLT